MTVLKDRNSSTTSAEYRGIGTQKDDVSIAALFLAHLHAGNVDLVLSEGCADFTDGTGDIQIVNQSHMPRGIISRRNVLILTIRVSFLPKMVPDTTDSPSVVTTLTLIR